MVQGGRNRETFKSREWKNTNYPSQSFSPSIVTLEQGHQHVQPGPRPEGAAHGWELCLPHVKMMHTAAPFCISLFSEILQTNNSGGTLLGCHISQLRTLPQTDLPVTNFCEGKNISFFFHSFKNSPVPLASSAVITLYSAVAFIVAFCLHRIMFFFIKLSLTYFIVMFRRSYLQVWIQLQQVIK